ncbi:MAG: phospho-N-acetylmuramoyl-pentapeptide-transferase [Chloroflexi bacterium]|nr:phospho-N-acetylmuramoyl-pentapeptide-transferase [Chloroflexota bacterium]
MAYSLTLGTLSFLFAVIWGSPLIRFLRNQQIGETIRSDGPSSHLTKLGTPTMGGIMILVPTIVFNALLTLPVYPSILLPLAVSVGCGFVGAIDDWMGIKGRRGEQRGILARYKLAWLTIIAFLAALILYGIMDLHSMAIPTRPEKINIGLLYIPVATFIIVGSANAVNFSDGLDGLAASTSAIAFACVGVIAFLQGQMHLVTYCFSMTGAILAFLWYNAYPAQLFMGDTGSLAVGATLGTVFLMTGQWLLLPIIGIIFVSEALSVILQVAFFKWTGGRRLFKMAPLHHHFELLGWSEVQTVQRFWLIGMLAGMIGIAMALI